MLIREWKRRAKRAQQYFQLRGVGLLKTFGRLGYYNITVVLVYVSISRLLADPDIRHVCSAPRRM